MEWISVDDKPIPAAKWVLAGLWIKNTFKDELYFEEEVVFYDEGRVENRADEETGWEIDSYSHWMPLPKPPEVK